jgi:hypothetical protein
MVLIIVAYYMTPDSRGRAEFEWIGQSHGGQLLLTPAGFEIRIGHGWAGKKAFATADSNPAVENGAKILGFVLGRRRCEFGIRERTVVTWWKFGLPWWYIAVFLAVFFGAPRVRRWQRLRSAGELRRLRRLPGVCKNCGYDLRASPHPGGPTLARCPECGKRN